MEPAKVLHLMEVQDKEKPIPGIFFLGLYDSSISVLSQQTRALNLAWALASERELATGARIAVIGAGAAGLTFSSAAAVMGAKVTLLEAGSRPFAVFCPADDSSEKSDRYLHPHISRWPAPGWFENVAKLPIGNWKACTPECVAGQILKSSIISKGLEEEVKLWCNADVSRLEQVEDSKWLVTYTGEPAEWTDVVKYFDVCEGCGKSAGPAIQPEDSCFGVPIQTEQNRFDLVVLAVGYGKEIGLKYSNSDDVITKSYWEAGSAPPRPTDPPERSNLFVSGGGDGGVADALRFLGADIDSRFIEELRDKGELEKRSGSWSAMFRRLFAFEKKVARAPSGERHYQRESAYRKLMSSAQSKDGVDLIDQYLGERTCESRKVTIADKSAGLLSKQRSLIHNFLLWRLYELGRLTFVSGNFQMASKQSGRISVEFQVDPGRHDDERLEQVGDGESEAKEEGPRLAESSESESKEGCYLRLAHPDHLVVRHGPEPLTNKGVVEKFVAKARADLEKKNEIGLTGSAFWPQGYFGRGRYAASESHPYAAKMRQLRMDVEITQEDTNSSFAEFDVTFYFEGLKLFRPLLLEHEVQQTEPFEMRLVDWRPKQQGLRVEVETGAEHRVPGWVEAYTIFAEKGSKSTSRGRDLEISFRGKPGMGTWLADGVGFPVYSDILVKRIVFSCKLINLKPIEPQVFLSSFRRRAYSEVNEDSTTVFAESIEVGDGGENSGEGQTKYELKWTWPKGKPRLRRELRKATGLSGHFVGIRWRSLEKTN